MLKHEVDSEYPLFHYLVDEWREGGERECLSAWAVMIA